MMMTASILDVFQIIFADIILSGDNALVIGMAAAGLPQKLRQRAIFIGMMAAAGLRILFAVIASHLLAIDGILLIGGALLAWVCWRFYNDLKEFNTSGDAGRQLENMPNEQLPNIKNTHFFRALTTILIADVSMSIDNIVAVAAIARDDTELLIFGLALAIAFMAFFASIIMRVMIRFRWLSYLGLGFLIYLTVMMFHDGLSELGIMLFA